MKTTLDLDDRLLGAAKRRAVAQGTTLKALVEDALRARLLPQASRGRRYRLALPVVADVAPPAVDLANRDALYDFMEQRR